MEHLEVSSENLKRIQKLSSSMKRANKVFIRQSAFLEAVPVSPDPLKRFSDARRQGSPPEYSSRQRLNS